MYSQEGGNNTTQKKRTGLNRKKQDPKQKQTSFLLVLTLA
jgi:hypothetical protein